MVYREFLNNPATWSPMLAKAMREKQKSEGVIMSDVNELVQVEVNKRLSDPVYLQDQLLRLIEDRKQLTETIQSREREIEALTPANDFYKAVTASDDLMEMSAVAKVLAYKGWGRNKIFDLLRDREIIRYNKEPYQKYVETGHFKTIEESFISPYGESMVYRKTMVTQKGLDLIRKLIEAEVA